MRSGWFKESYRHSLAAKGITTSKHHKFMRFAPQFPIDEDPYTAKSEKYLGPFTKSILERRKKKSESYEDHLDKLVEDREEADKLGYLTKRKFYLADDGYVMWETGEEFLERIGRVEREERKKVLIEKLISFIEKTGGSYPVDSQEHKDALRLDEEIRELGITESDAKLLNDKAVKAREEKHRNALNAELSAVKIEDEAQPTPVGEIKGDNFVMIAREEWNQPKGKEITKLTDEPIGTKKASYSLGDKSASMNIELSDEDIDAIVENPVYYTSKAVELFAAKRLVPDLKKKYPELVKDFPGENPRITKNYARFRQEDPNSFDEDTFRIKDSGKVKLVLGKKKGKMVVQSIMVPKSRWSAVAKNYAREMSLQRKKIEGPRKVKYVGNRVKNSLKGLSQRVKLAGSIRRKSSNPTDVDAVVVLKKKYTHEDVVRKLERMPGSRVVSRGSKLVRAEIDGVPVDIAISRKEDYGSQVMHWTGPAGANIYKRKLAGDKGMILNQFGLFKKMSDGSQKKVAGSERNIYKKLGVSYRKPEIRGTPR